MAATDVPCAWAPIDDELYRGYHDTEWGVPERDSRALWEKFQLDGHQAGLSWITILRKRETMREEFDGFEPEKIGALDEKRIDKALKNPGIIRSPIKIARHHQQRAGLSRHARAGRGLLRLRLGLRRRQADRHPARPLANVQAKTRCPNRSPRT